MKSSTNRPLAAKKQFTIFNRLAAIGKCSSMKNSACGTINKNRQYLFSIILLLTLHAGTAWGATETITLSDFGWSNATKQTEITATSATIALQANSATTAPTYYTSDGLRLYGVKNATTGGTIAFTPETGITITKIVFTHTSSSSGVLAIKSGTGSYSSKTWSGTLTAGNTVSLVSTNSNANYNPQVRITQIVITYTEAASCDKKVTIQKGTESNGTFTLETTGTHETCNGEVVTKLSNITPDANYVFSEITQTGINTGVTIDQENKTVTYAQNTSGTSTVNVVFVQKQSATITLSEAGVTQSITGKYVGDSYTLPSSTDAECGDKTFVGWSTVTIDNSAAKPTSNFYEPGASVTLGATNTFYAVFAEGGGLSDVQEVLLNYTGGTKSDLTNVEGISANGLGSDYAESNAPYRVKLDNTGDYILYTNNSKPYISQVYFKVKMIGGNSTSTMTIKTSNDGTNYTTKGECSISGEQNSVKDFLVTINTEAKYLQLYFTKGSNVGFGPLIIYTKSSSYQNYTTTCVTETTYTVTIDENIKNGIVTADPTEAAEGVTVTLTATPNANYTFGSWTVKDASNADVAVNSNTFTMPASNVTVSASFVEKSKYTITWNVAEGSVAPTQVYEGNALGTLPTADNCSSGKVFIGWTEATSVNADGSSLVLAKATDVPASDKTYNAIYVTETSTGGGGATTGSATLKYSGTTTTNMAEGNNAATVGLDASDWSVVADKGGNNNYPGLNKNGYIPLYYAAEGNGNTVTVTSNAAVISDITVTYTAKEYNAGVIVVNGETITATSTSDTEATYAINASVFTISNKNTTNIQVRIKSIEINYVIGGAVISRTDYSLDCEANNEPFLTVDETAFDFGTLAQNETATETFTVTGGYLAEDVALTISGTNASFFSVSPTTIAKADDIEETITVTYNPTATGDHTATLTIKTGDITKEIALSGKVLAPGKWVLVKDVATLSASDEIIIAAAAADYAIGAATSNNYKGAAITKVGETANADAGVTVLKVEATGVAEAPYALKDGSKYLYAAGPSNNYLKAQVTNNVNGQWAITITDGVASIVAAKSSNRNVMQYNPNSGSPIFACYASASQGALAIYRNSENVVKPVISGDTDFTGSTQVTITTQSGLTVYYTTDGTDPNKTSAQYTAPFTINATTTVKAIAYDASSNASGVAEMTFTKHDLVNVATAMALEKDEIAYFDEFEVVKVVTGKGNIYIKDANGHGLIYDNTLAGELKDGDRVQGFIGISSPYNGLPEAKPVDGLTVADLTISAGVAAEPYDFTSTALAETDINKYIVFNNVEITANTDMSTNPTLTIGDNSVKFYNQFGVSKTLEADKIYDIYGFVATYNSTLQVYFYQALEDGEVVKTYTVTYNAGGATGEVPVDNNEYTEGAQVYLKSATSLTKEGYDYKGWKVTDEGGNEIAVSSNKFNMPASNVTATAQWEEIVVTPVQDFSNGYWVLVTEENQLTAGDKVVFAAAEEDFAMKSYESGNNCKQIAITKLGDKRFLKWNSEVGVFQLAVNGTNYTIQDVNSNQYLYAAGTGTDNHLKATNEIPADADAAKPCIWTISYNEGVVTVKATSENRNILRYNTSSDLFACYASGQKDIAIYKHVENIDATKVTPSVVEQSYFSVGNNKYVQFSTGNLQYEVGTNTWSFASEQYEVVGSAAYDPANPTNTNYGLNETGYTGKLDLFAWSSDGKFGVNPSNKDADYQEAFVDWGTLVNESGWFTLTKDEMNYILARTKNGKKLWALATVCDMNGLILLPDNWNTSITLDYGYIPANFNYTKNQIDAAAWQTLEAAGAVFLPEAGTRVGGHGNKDQGGGPNEFDAHGDYFHVDNVNEMGYYWLSTNSGNFASYLILPGWNEGPTEAEDDDIALAPQVWSREKRRGNSVRLVKEVTPDYTRDKQGAGVYGTVCYPENIVWCNGATLYEVAGKEGNKVIFDEVTTPEAGMPYIFIADQEVLYFFCGTDEAATAGNYNSLQGTFTQIDPSVDNILVENYMLVNNIIKKCGANCGLNANRAYFIGSELETLGSAPSPIQGRRRISLEVTNENTATSLDGIVVPEGETVKVIVNGQLIIIRGGEKFNAQGVRF